VQLVFHEQREARLSLERQVHESEPPGVVVLAGEVMLGNTVELSWDIQEGSHLGGMPLVARRRAQNDPREVCGEAPVGHRDHPDDLRQLRFMARKAQSSNQRRVGSGGVSHGPEPIPPR
jgi:hypothetical protein